MKRRVLELRSSPRKRGPRAVDRGVWIPACAGMNGIGRREFITLLGCAAAWPRAALAQQTKTFHRVGILWPGSPAANTFRLDALRNGLRELGYEENRNIAFLQSGPERQVTQEGLTALAAELVQ